MIDRRSIASRKDRAGAVGSGPESRRRQTIFIGFFIFLAAMVLINRGIINRRLITRGSMDRGLIGDEFVSLHWMPRDADLAALGSRIRELRSRRGWSQEGFADRCGLDRTYVGGIERGERNLAVINLLRIARTLEVPVGTLFEKVESATSRP